MIGCWLKGMNLSTRTADIIIIGAGAAGLELARIASITGQQVVLFEQGASSGRHIYQRIPLMVGKIIGNRQFVDAAVTTAQTSAGNRTLPVLTGRGLGGSSRVNGNVAYVGPAERYAHIFHPLGLDFTGILERLNSDSSAPRPHTWNDALSERFLKAAESLGAAPVDDPDGHGAFGGASILHVNTKRGLRHNHLEGFCASAVHENIRVIRSTVQKITFDGPRATGVQYQNGATAKLIQAGEIILCAGAIESPLLLMRSGVGGAQMLTDANLPVHHDLPHVGKHLKDHANLRLPFSCPGHDTLNQKTRGAKAIWEGLKFIAGSKDTILRGPGASTGINIATSDNIFEDAFRIQLVHFTQDRSKISQKGIVFEKQQKASLGIYPLWPKSEGAVRVGAEGTQIDPGFLINDADVKTTLKGMAHARAMMQEMGVSPDLLNEPDDAILRSGVYSGYHLIGSNRMSLDATGGVVAPDFTVHGLSGLSVCDASVLPDHLSSHSYLPVIAMTRMFAQIRGWAA